MSVANVARGHRGKVMLQRGKGVWSRRVRATYRIMAFRSTSLVRFYVPIFPLLCTLLVPTSAFAQTITPTERVRTNVVVRATPSTRAAAIAALLSGQQLTLKRDLPYWYEIELSDGTIGYVSKTWTRIDIATAQQPTGAAAYTIEAADVGTGLAILVTAPDFTLLYDGGSNDDLARGSTNRLLAFLRLAHPALRRIDYLVLSHPHRDHVELLPDIFDQYDIGQVWDSGRVNPICGYRAFLERVAIEPGVVYHNALGSNDIFRPSFAAQTCYGQAVPAETLAIARGAAMDQTPIILGTGARMTILHADGAPYSSPNENSVVARLDLGQHRLLLMGDAEAGGRKDPPATAPATNSIEGKLLACCRAAVAADIMVAGHHGSRTSSRTPFLDAVGAQTFIISSGPTRYGSVTLPDAIIADEMARRGTLWRTDRDDTACARAIRKTGPDVDGRPGGCDNIQLNIDAQGRVWGAYVTPAE